MSKNIAFMLILVLSFLAVARTDIFNLVLANFMPFPRTPNTDPPIVKLKTLENQYVNSAYLNFSVIKPESWRNEWVDGNIKSVCFSLDGQLNSIEVGKRTISTGGLVYDIDNLTKTSQHSINLTGLHDGQHIIELNVTAVTYYNPPDDYWTVYEYAMLFSEKILLTTNTSSGSMSFSIDSIAKKVFPDKIPPEVTILSLENKTFKTLDFPLNITINEPVSQIKYSLDGQANKTISGNLTLHAPSYGDHNLTVYAYDDAGNMGSSKAITFTIIEPESFPTTIIIVASGISAIAVGAALLVHYKKRKL